MTNNLSSKKSEEGRACLRRRAVLNAPFVPQGKDGRRDSETNRAPKDETIDGVQIWKQFEDLLIPGLQLTLLERAVYSYLLRHSRLEGKPRVRFSIPWLAHGTGLSAGTARSGMRRLVGKGALRLAERGKHGHVVELRLPGEIRKVRAGRIEAEKARRGSYAVNLEDVDFLATAARRRAIHEREEGRCFYCLRRTTAANRCIDHVIPRMQMGSNSYRNLVSSCAECNAEKQGRNAGDFLRWLYREGRLTRSELAERLGALEKLAAGELRPAVGSEAHGKDLTQRTRRGEHRGHKEEIEGEIKSRKKLPMGGAQAEGYATGSVRKK